MKLYHVLVEQEEDWFVGRVLEREGITTQGRTIDELIFMVRDAIAGMWNEKGVQLELLVPDKALTSFERPTPRAGKRKRRLSKATAA
jgi:predicted RNase H-like HicB family nuclease